MFVVEGKINLSIRTSTGKKITLATLRQGDVLGMYSVLFNQPFVFSAEVEKSTRLLKLD